MIGQLARPTGRLIPRLSPADELHFRRVSSLKQLRNLQNRKLAHNVMIRTGGSGTVIMLRLLRIVRQEGIGLIRERLGNRLALLANLLDSLLT
jgi:hypothetical protein